MEFLKSSSLKIFRLSTIQIEFFILIKNIE